MPVFQFRVTLEPVRGVKAFLRLEGGVTRGASSGTGQKQHESKSVRKQVRKQHKPSGGKNREVTQPELDGEARLPPKKSGAGTLPDFVIVGAQKCGTTFLYNRLCQHPCVEPASAKEVHYFDIHFKEGVDWYRSHFPPLARRDGRRIIAGEATPYYLPHPLAARRMAETIPRARLIVLLRNPIDRAYSHYQHRVRKGIETLSFEEAIEAEEERLNGEVEKMLDDEHYFSFNHQHFSYLTRGVYVDQLEEWSKFFGEDQTLILRGEDLFGDMSAAFERVIVFLGLPRWSPRPLDPRNGDRYGKMSPETRQRLRAYFEPHNQRLYDYLDADLGWRD